MTNSLSEWATYVSGERALLKPVLDELGYVLDEEQPHTGGERYLMQAVTTTAGPKVTLLGRRASDNLRVVIKATSHPSGAREIEHERMCRATLGEIAFAYHAFYAPQEVAYVKRGSLTVAIQEFIEQESTFLERPLKEQFDLALTGFKIQEGAHATTYGHLKHISKVFPFWGSAEYVNAMRTFSPPPQLIATLEEGRERIEQYSGFLTHSDFVPHNIRVRNNKLYLLDHSSLRFGNKHEGWARFINFMALHNPPLADAFHTYLRDNRTPEESESLRYMRIYRLAEILSYYRGTLTRSEGDLLLLNQARVEFWTNVLDSVQSRSTLPDSVREAYIAKRDALRSEDEKRRQEGLH